MLDGFVLIYMECIGYHRLRGIWYFSASCQRWGNRFGYESDLPLTSSRLFAPLEPVATEGS